MKYDCDRYQPVAVSKQGSANDRIWPLGAPDGDGQTGRCRCTTNAPGIEAIVRKGLLSLFDSMEQRAPTLDKAKRQNGPCNRTISEP